MSTNKVEACSTYCRGGHELPNREPDIVLPGNESKLDVDLYIEEGLFAIEKTRVVCRVHSDIAELYHKRENCFLSDSERNLTVFEYMQGIAKMPDCEWRRIIDNYPLEKLEEIVFDDDE